MWPAPIGWWYRVSPAIYTTQAQDLGSVVVDSLLACLAFGRVGEHTFLYWQCGTAVHFRQQPLLRGTSSRVCAPHYIPFRVLPWSQPNLVQRSGAPGDVQYLRTVYREYEINALVELEQKLCSCCSWGWDLEYTGLVTNLGPVPFVPWGTSQRVRRSKNIHNEEGFYLAWNLGSRGKRCSHSGVHPCFHSSVEASSSLKVLCFI